MKSLQPAVDRVTKTEIMSDGYLDNSKQIESDYNIYVFIEVREKLEKNSYFW